MAEQMAGQMVSLALHLEHQKGTQMALLMVDMMADSKVLRMANLENLKAYQSALHSAPQTANLALLRASSTADQMVR